jgi:tripeptidyl-peptidase I
MTGVAPGVAMQVFDTPAGDILSWALELNDTPRAASVHALTCGEQDVRLTARSTAAVLAQAARHDRAESEFMKAAARGITVVASSGDCGPYCDCGVPDPDKPASADDDWEPRPLAGQPFTPPYPQASQFVCTVGGTQFPSDAATGVRGGDAIGPEAGVQVGHDCDGQGDFDRPGGGWLGQHGESGGGFSWRYPRPAYQEAAVSAFLSSAGAAGTLPHASLFNGSAYGFPTIAALAGLPPSDDGSSCVGSLATSSFSFFY